ERAGHHDPFARVIAEQESKEAESEGQREEKLRIEQRCEPAQRPTAHGHATLTVAPATRRACARRCTGWVRFYTVPCGTMYVKAMPSPGVMAPRGVARS